MPSFWSYLTRNLRSEIRSNDWSKFCHAFFIVMISNDFVQNRFPKSFLNIYVSSSTYNFKKEVMIISKLTQEEVFTAEFGDVVVRQNAQSGKS